MPMRELEIQIGEDGSVQLHVKGFKGKACLGVAKLVEEAVGRIQSRRETSEFYEPEEQVRFNLEQRQRPGGPHGG